MFRNILSLLCLFTLATTSGRAQIMTGSIAGRVADPSGAAVADAAIALAPVSTGATRNSVTDPAGNFLLSGVDSMLA